MVFVTKGVPQSFTINHISSLSSWCHIQSRQSHHWSQRRQTGRSKTRCNLRRCSTARGSSCPEKKCLSNWHFGEAIHTVFRQEQKKAILKTFTAISQILTNLTGDEARLCLPRADDSLVTANALCCLVFCVARLAVDLVEKG